MKLQYSGLWKYAEGAADNDRTDNFQMWQLKDELFAKQCLPLLLEKLHCKTGGIFNIP